MVRFYIRDKNWRVPQMAGRAKAPTPLKLITEFPPDVVQPLSTENVPRTHPLHKRYLDEAEKTFGSRDAYIVAITRYAFYAKDDAMIAALDKLQAEDDKANDTN
jgi:hypothetical protein